MLYDSNKRERTVRPADDSREERTHSPRGDVIKDGDRLRREDANGPAIPLRARIHSRPRPESSFVTPRDPARRDPAGDPQARLIYESAMVDRDSARA